MKDEDTRSSAAPDRVGLTSPVGRGGVGGLAERLGGLARSLRAQPTMEETLTEAVQTALTLIPRASEASISMVQARRRVESRAASGELPRIVDAIQTETGQGPCMDAALRKRIVRVPDLSRESRWPKFTGRAWDAGARSMLAIPLFVDRDNLGGLNLYGAETGDFEAEDEQIGVLIATHAAIALADAKEIRNLNSALASRDLIGQAKGILMERYKLSAQQAFALLTTASTTTNSKLVTVAEELTRTGTFPTPNPPSAPNPPTAPDDMTAADDTTAPDDMTAPDDTTAPEGPATAGA